MSDMHEFRSARLVLDGDNITFVAGVKITEIWETISFPLYLEQPTLRTLPTVKRIVATVSRKYHESSPLHQLLNGSSGSIEFTSGDETLEFENARVTSWTIHGEFGGEFMEEVELSLETET